MLTQNDLAACAANPEPAKGDSAEMLLAKLLAGGSGGGGVVYSRLHVIPGSATVPAPELAGQILLGYSYTVIGPDANMHEHATADPVPLPDGATDRVLLGAGHFGDIRPYFTTGPASTVYFTAFTAPA